jgi:DNA-binding NtrC family response regulator
VSARALLLVEDEEQIRFFVARFFRQRGFEVTEASSVAQGREAFRAARPDVAILDHCLPDGTGLDLLRALRESDASVPIIVLTAHGSIDLAVAAIKEGAEQFLTKPVELPALHTLVERTIENQRNRQARLAGRVKRARGAIDPFAGDSAVMKRLAQQAHRLLASGSPILIQGETGTGKGVLASWLHLGGPRSEEAFVDLNCAGLSREFLETELFGHEKGAFTGATASKVGLLDIAHRGTLFLDEIGDMDAAVQSKLLKVLEDQRFRRLGDVRDRQVDVRLIAASHRNLKEMAQKGEFRADLFYRISTLLLVVPPLRDRGGDIALLARSLLAQIGADLGRAGVALSSEAEHVLLGYAWPGNIRELRNVLERAALLGDGERVTARDLMECGLGVPDGQDPSVLSLRAAERRHILAVLGSSGGNVPQAAQILGLSRSALYKKLKAHGIAMPKPERATPRKPRPSRT